MPEWVWNKDQQSGRATNTTKTTPPHSWFILMTQNLLVESYLEVPCKEGRWKRRSSWTQGKSMVEVSAKLIFHQSTNSILIYWQIEKPCPEHGQASMNAGSMCESVCAVKLKQEIREVAAWKKRWKKIVK